MKRGRLALAYTSCYENYLFLIIRKALGIPLEQKFKALIVWLILNGKTEEALVHLAKHYGVKVPKLEIGLPKGRKKKLGCYNARNKMISVFDSDMLKEPFVVLHEFYHHLRAVGDEKHKGTEKYANKFAKEFIDAYKSVSAEFDFSCTI
jgi:Zn-dependent peptidase ImmA (M78 family)